MRRWTALLFCLSSAGLSEPLDEFHHHIQPLTESMIQRAQTYSHREGCPVSLHELSWVRVTYLGMDNAAHEGDLLVHSTVAKEVVEIFRTLFHARFPIEKMKLIDDYEGSDDRSMEDNNTSAFNCRPSGGNKNVYSKHSFGLAIDINPRINPYILKNGKVRPPSGKEFENRGKTHKGMIVASDVVVKAFTSRGWTWGGSWNNSKDYQHFEKRMKGMENDQPLKAR